MCYYTFVFFCLFNIETQVTCMSSWIIQRSTVSSHLWFPLFLSRGGQLSVTVRTGRIVMCNRVIINIITSNYCDYKWLFLQVIIKILNYPVFKHQDTAHAFQNITHYILMSVSMRSWSVSYYLMENLTIFVLLYRLSIEVTLS